MFNWLLRNKYYTSNYNYSFFHFLLYVFSSCILKLTHWVHMSLGLLCLISYCCSVTQSWPTLCDAMDSSMPGLPVLHHLLEFAQTHVHWVSDAIQPSQPLSSPSPPAFNLSQHQGLFQWVGSSLQVAKVLEIIDRLAYYHVSLSLVIFLTFWVTPVFFWLVFAWHLFHLFAFKLPL